MLQKSNFLLRLGLLPLALALAAGGLTSRAARARQDAGKGVDLRTVSKLPSREKRWALLVGVSNYEDPNITRLRGANDAKALKEALVRYAGFPERQVILLTTDEPREWRPTRENIIKRLSNLRGLVPKDGLFLFSFSGHGVESNNEAFLLPSSISYDEDVDVLRENAVSAEYVRRYVKAMGVQQVLMLLDACRNDPTNSRSDSTNPLTAAYTRGFSFDVRNKEVTAFATLYATSVGERAYEYAEKEEGYFTWAVVEGLKGAAANAKGEVTLYGLKRYVEEVVPREVRANLKRLQQPFAIVEGYMGEDLVLAVAGEPPPVVTAAQPSTQRDRDWVLVDKKSRPEIELFLSKYKDDFEAALTLRRLEESEPRAGELMTVKLSDKVQMTFVYCPPGTFKMGNDGYSSERPAYNVTIGRGFWLGQTEVTQEQWGTVMDSGSTHTGDSGGYPVNGVNWIDVQGFISRLNERQNVYTYRLPTEAEWEYAARAGTKENEVADLDSVAWYFGNSGDKRLEGGYDEPKASTNNNRVHPVKQKSPNRWGLYDMLGNVWEWVSTKSAPYPYNQSDGRESQSGEGTLRINRGGGFLDGSPVVSPSTRSFADASRHIGSVGFRLAVSLRR